MPKQSGMNYGGLQGAVPAAQNIVYYRRGFDELSLNITNACPNACVFCIRDRDPGWGVSNLYLARDPSVAEILAAFAAEAGKIKAAGVALDKVKICGYGEPILRFHDLLLLTAGILAVAPQAAIQLTTTGWPYYRFVGREDERLLGLAAAGLTDVYLSLTTPARTDYLKWVQPGADGADGEAFDDALRFARAARRAGLRLTLGFMRLALKSEQEARALAAELGAECRIREFEAGNGSLED